MMKTKVVKFELKEAEEMCDQCAMCDFKQGNCKEDCEEEWYWIEVEEVTSEY